MIDTRYIAEATPAAARIFSGKISKSPIGSIFVTSGKDM